MKTYIKAKILINLSLFISFLCFYSNCSGQYTLDSISILWKQELKSDSVRLGYLHRLFIPFNEKNPDSTLMVLDHLIDYSINQSKPEAGALGYRFKAFFYEYENNNIQVVNNFKKSLELSTTARDTAGILESLQDLARVNSNKGEYTAAIPQLQDYLELAEKFGKLDPYDLAHTTGLISMIYYNLKDYDKALEYTRQEYDLVISELKDYDQYQVNCLSFMGRIYQAMDDHESALDVYFKLLPMTEELEMEQSTAIVLMGIGGSYLELGNFDGALEHYLCALEINKRIKDRAWTTIVNYSANLSSIGQLYRKKKNYKKALQYYAKGLKVKKEADIQMFLSQDLKELAAIHRELGQYDKSEDYCTQSLKIAESDNSINYQLDACQCLYETYKAMGHNSQALIYLERSNALQDSLREIESFQALQKMEIKNQMMQDSIAMVEKEAAIQLVHQKELNKKTRLQNGLMGLAVIILLVAGGLWNRNRYVKRSNEKLAAAKERAERSEKYKEQFLANMSHEIRTPMHAISGMLNILKRNNHLKEQESYLDAMSSSAESLIVILNDVLDLSKIEAGKLTIHKIPFSPSSVVDNVFQVLKYKAEDKALRTNSEIGGDVPDIIEGDPGRMQQILVNLVGNAIKFTDKGVVELKVSAVNGMIRYSVSDTGIGIPESQLEHIFEAFEQSKNDQKSKIGGTGLGLNISKQLVELQGGKIWAESEVGKGSTFHVELPLIALSQSVVKPGTDKADKLNAMRLSLKGLRILLAEDNPFNRMIAKDDLTYYIEDVHLDVVENGKEAVEYFEPGKYDIILMDVQMPELDGFEATRQIRQIEKTNNSLKRIPVIAMTASLLKSELNRCMEAGMDNYIPKPYQAEELIRPIFEVVRK